MQHPSACQKCALFSLFQEGNTDLSDGQWSHISLSPFLSTPCPQPLSSAESNRTTILKKQAPWENACSLYLHSARLEQSTWNLWLTLQTGGFWVALSFSFILKSQHLLIKCRLHSRPHGRCWWLMPGWTKQGPSPAVLTGLLEEG